MRDRCDSRHALHSSHLLDHASSATNAPRQATAATRSGHRTRRKLYDERGHGGQYRQVAACALCSRMRDVMVRLHVEGVLSEGQAARATGLDRVSLRRLADAVAEQAVAENVTRETSEVRRVSFASRRRNR